MPQNALPLILKAAPPIANQHVVGAPLISVSSARKPQQLANLNAQTSFALQSISCNSMQQQLVGLVLSPERARALTSLSAMEQGDVTALYALVEREYETMEKDEEVTHMKKTLPKEYEFYAHLRTHLKCMIRACEVIASNMVGKNTEDSTYSFARDLAQNGVAKTMLGIVKSISSSAMKSGLKAIPGGELVVQVIETLKQFKDDRDHALAVFQVAYFSTLAADDFSVVIEKVARFMVRARVYLRTGEKGKAEFSMARRRFCR